MFPLDKLHSKNCILFQEEQCVLQGGQYGIT